MVLEVGITKTTNIRDLVVEPASRADLNFDPQRDVSQSDYDAMQATVESYSRTHEWRDFFEMAVDLCRLRGREEFIIRSWATTGDLKRVVNDWLENRDFGDSIAMAAQAVEAFPDIFGDRVFWEGYADYSSTWIASCGAGWEEFYKGFAAWRILYPEEVTKPLWHLDDHRKTGLKEHLTHLVDTMPEDHAKLLADIRVADPELFEEVRGKIPWDLYKERLAEILGPNSDVNSRLLRYRIEASLASSVYVLQAETVEIGENGLIITPPSSASSAEELELPEVKEL